MKGVRQKHATSLMDHAHPAMLGLWVRLANIVGKDVQTISAICQTGHAQDAMKDFGAIPVNINVVTACPVHAI